MTLEDLYNEIIEDKDKWNYYNRDIEAPDLACTNSCYNFILEYIKLSKKSNNTLVDRIKFLRDKEPKRLRHIVSTFFLGITIYYKSDKRKQVIDTKLKEIMTKNEINVESQFCYLWFMTTLFHDLGYYYEVNKDYNCIREPLNNLIGVPALYDQILNSYSCFRKDICDCADHGIVAGKLLYDDLCKIREYEHHKQKNNHKDSNNLYWGKDLEILYKYVASCISVHNIFFIRDEEGDTNEEYYKKHMPSLVLKSKNSNNCYDDYPINFKEYPLLFLLCFVDSIEPLKSGLELNDIKIALKKRTIIIDTKDEYYSNRIIDLNKWLTKTIKLKPKRRLGAKISLKI